MSEVVLISVDKVALLVLQRGACVFQQPEYFFNVFDVVFELARQDQHLNQVHDPGIEPRAGDDEIQAALKRFCCVLQS